MVVSGIEAQQHLAVCWAGLWAAFQQRLRKSALSPGLISAKRVRLAQFPLQCMTLFP